MNQPGETAMEVREANPDLVRMNQRNAEFWVQQRRDRDRRIKEPSIFATAMADMNSELARGVPIRAQKIIEAALADAETAKQRFISERARNAGKTNKSDPLQKVIEDAARQKPTITEAELRQKLENQAGFSPIQEITETIIYVTRSNGATKKVRVSGLKYRLLRAKKKLKKS